METPQAVLLLAANVKLDMHQQIAATVLLAITRTQMANAYYVSEFLDRVTRLVHVMENHISLAS